MENFLYLCIMKLVKDKITDSMRDDIWMGTWVKSHTERVFGGVPAVEGPIWVRLCHEVRARTFTFTLRETAKDMYTK